MQDMALLSQFSHDPLKNTILRIIYRFQSRTRDWRKYFVREWLAAVFNHCAFDEAV